MLTFISKPKNISFSKNPIVYCLRATDTYGNIFKSNGNQSVFSFLALFTLQNNDTITLTFTDTYNVTTAVTFTAKTTPVSDTDIPLTASFQDIANIFAANRLIAPFLHVFYSSFHSSIGGTVSMITAETINVEPGWTVGFTTNMNTDVRLAGILNYPYSYSNAPKNYRIGYQINFEHTDGNNNWEKIYYGEVLPRGDGGDIYLNIQDVIDSAVQSNRFENPFRNYSTGLTSAGDNTRRYFVAFKEIWDGTTTAWTVDDIRETMVGGVPDRVWLAKDWFTFDANLVPRVWLTHKSNIWKIQRTTTEWLSWYNFTDAILNVRLKVDAYLADGTVSSSIIANTLYNGVQKNRTATFCITPASLGLSSNCIYYKVQAVWQDNGDIPVSPVRTYIIDDTPQRDNYTVAYINAFGLPETLNCTGEITRSLVMDSFSSKGVRGVNFGGLVTRNQRTINAINSEIIYRSGYLKSRDKEVFSELLTSPVLFDITNSRYLALNLKEAKAAKSELLHDDGEFNYSIEFLCEQLINSKAFAPDDYESGDPVLTEPIQRLVIPGYTVGSGNTIPVLGDNNGTIFTDGDGQIFIINK